MPRIARMVVPNFPHHVTQKGTNRIKIFFDNDDRRYFLQYLKYWTNKTETEIWAYCLMSNHFHLLLVPKEYQSLGKCLHGITFRYAQYFNKKYRRIGRFWQNRYFSCPIDKDNYLWSVARYIERNPVRAKIVKNPGDWKWSSAKAHINGEMDYILSFPDWINETEIKAYRSFVNEEGKEKEIRKATSTGRPLGDLRFIKRLEKRVGRYLRPRKGGRPRK